MKHVWSILCTKSIIDNTTNNISLFDIVEKLVITLKPQEKQVARSKPITLPVSFEIVSLLTKKQQKQSEKAELIIELLNPKKKKIIEHNKKIEIPKNFNRIRVRGKINALTVEENGTYLFVIKLKEEKQIVKKVAEIPLEISTIVETKEPLPINS